MSAVPRSPLCATGLTKSFGPVTVLDGLDLEIRAGEIHALLGENGSGKSTTIKILSGYHAPDSGEVLVDGVRLHLGSPTASIRAGVRCVHQDLGLVNTSSILDNIGIGAGFSSRFGVVRRNEMRSIIRRELLEVGLDLDPEREVGDLKAAEKTAVAIARALHGQELAPVKLLVLDEPTASMPMDEIELLLSIVRAAAAKGVGVLYVSHRLDEVLELAATVTVLRDGRMIANRAVEGLNHNALVTMLVGDELEVVTRASRSLSAANRGQADDSLLKLVEFGSGSVDPLTLEAQPGEIIGVAGINGSGREAILPAIFGSLPDVQGQVVVTGQPIRSGSIRAAIRAGIAYLPPDRATQSAVLELSAGENLTLTDRRRHWRFPRIQRGRESTEVDSWFERLNVHPSDGRTFPLKSFSGGNQQKVLFAKWLRCTPKVLLLDEPTHGVDVGAKAQLHRNILDRAEGGAAVIISSVDADELAALCHRVLIFRRGRVTAELTGAQVTPFAISSAVLGQHNESGRGAA